MRHSKLPFALSLLVAPVLALAAPCAAQEASRSSNELVVNGKTIGEMEIRRGLVYMAGSQHLEAAKMQIFIEQEIRSRVEAGEDAEAYLISEEAVDAEIAKIYESMAENYAGVDPDEILAQNNLRAENLKTRQRQSMIFARVFLPDDPRDWPDITVEAIRGSMGETFEQFFEQAVQAHEQRQSEEAPPANAGGQAMFKQIMSQSVIKALNDAADIETAGDGLPAEIAMRVNGAPIRTETIYQLIEDNLSEAERTNIRTWLAKTTALRADLEEKGFYLDDEAFEEVYGEHAARYEGTLFNIEMIARTFKRFPSMEAYKEHFRLLESYRKMIAEEMTDEVLTEHLPRANRLLGLSRVNVEIILCSAYDFGLKRWKEDGWKHAKERATAASKALAEGRAWNEVLEEFSDFYDPPLNEDQLAQVPAGQLKDKGRFGMVNRNDLAKKLEETEFMLFLTGVSVTDAIFYEQEEGTIDGPFRGLYGYYISRVTQRTPPQKEMDLADADQRRLVEQDYLNMRFNAHAEAVLRAARVVGL